MSKKLSQQNSILILLLSLLCMRSPIMAAPITTNANTPNTVIHNDSRPTASQPAAIKAPQTESSIQGQSNHTLPTTATRQQLQKVITSDVYATSKTRKQWQRKPKDQKVQIDHKNSWLGRLIEYLLDFLPNGFLSVYQLRMLATTIKILLIAALVVLILWIARHAQKTGWLNMVLPRGLRSASVSTQKASRSQQQLGELPEHQQIGVSAQRLLADGKLADAASILYRGSLRWLADNHLLVIAPATTELQCIKQIQTINRHNGSSFKAATNLPISYSINAATKDYINQIIQNWMQVAYDAPYIEANAATLNLRLNELAAKWLSVLPTTTSTTTNSVNLVSLDTSLKEEG